MLIEFSYEPSTKFFCFVKKTLRKNRLLFFLISLLVCLRVLAFSTTVGASTAAEREIWIIGDSLTEGYGVAKGDAFPALLQKKIETRSLQKTPKIEQKNGQKKDLAKNQGNPTSSASMWKVVNAGNSGWTSASGTRQLRWLLKKSRPEILILALGANDGLRGLDVGAMKKNLEETLREAQSHGAVLVLAGMQAPPNYGKSYTKEFAQAFRDLARSTGARLIPFLLEGVAGEKELNLADGIHPNEKGHAIVAETVFKKIEDLL